MSVQANTTCTNDFSRVGFVRPAQARLGRADAVARQNHKVSRLPLFHSALLALIALGTVGELVPALLSASKGAYVVVLGIGLLANVRRGWQVAVEGILLTLFAVWAIGTTALHYVNEDAFLEGALRLLTVVPLALIVGSEAARRCSPAVGLVALTAAGLVLTGAAAFSDQFRTVAETMQRANDLGIEPGQISAVRVGGIAPNPNTMALVNVWGVAGVLFLWPRVRRMLIRTVLLGVVAVLFAGIVSSASRTAAGSMVVLVGAWLWFNRRTVLLQNARVAFQTAAFCGLLSIALAVVLPHTYLWERINTGRDASRRDKSATYRFALQAESLQVFLKSPIWGVGLLQYRFHSGLRVGAHTEYGDIFASTGAVGGVLYFALYACILRRLVRIRSLRLSNNARSDAGLGLAILAMYATSTIGNVMYPTFFHWIGMASVWGFSRGAERLKLNFAAGGRGRRLHLPAPRHMREENQERTETGFGRPMPPQRFM